MGSLDHLLAELGRIELLIQAQIARARQVQEADREFQGLYISEQELDALLQRPAGLPRWATDPTPLSTGSVRERCDRLVDHISARKAASAKAGVTLRLETLSRMFGLTPFDVDALLICLASELDLRYERLYAYLQDDVTKKRPSVDLVLNLLSDSYEAKLEARRRFSPESPLVRAQLVQVFDDPSQQQPPLLSRYLKASERVVSYLLGSDEVDATVRPYVELREPCVGLADLVLSEPVADRLAVLARDQATAPVGRVLYLQGPYGVGKEVTAGALCRVLGMKLLVIDLGRLVATEPAPGDTALRLIEREARLQHAAPYWSGLDAVLADDKRSWLAALLRVAGDGHGLRFFAGETTWEPADALRDVRFARIELPRPNDTDRLRLWAAALNGHATAGGDLDLTALATKFKLTGGQIQDTAATAVNLARWRDARAARLTMGDLYEACRLQSNRKLATLAQKVVPQYKWDDIILPPDRQQLLREICNYVKYRSLVYDEWGFDGKLSLGKGLNALFSGPPGTGKTMAAEIIAGELGLDLYKIDLSTVVSKYIGETEKNLSRIFAEAETSNGILFFDEADALFGKRSEVRDSHDRYANIEIGYLLQKMEEYGGVVILATNLRKNMDDAFVRRMHFTLEFPFPTEKDRRRIWERIWPEQLPRSDALDLDFMARRFEMAGGHIRNVALAAAFLAAGDRKVVDMEHVFHATRREYQKMGKVVAEGEFTEHSGREVRAT